MKKIIQLWSNLSRVYEIAKLGNFSLRVAYQTDYIAGKDDYAEIKEFYSDANFSAKGDLIVEITAPYSYEPKVQGETLEDIHQRVEKAKTNILPTEYNSDSCETLLNVAANRLNFSMKDVKLVKKIAGVIAQLDNSDKIKVEHIAEASQYRAFMKPDIAVIAESNTMKFGKHILIDICDIDPDDAKKAIAYLKKVVTK